MDVIIDVTGIIMIPGNQGKIVQVTVPIQLLSVAAMSVIICYVVLIQNIPVNATHVKTAIVHELE